MANINQIEKDGVTYDIEDSVARSDVNGVKNAYLKNATYSDNTLTLTNQNDDEVEVTITNPLSQSTFTCEMSDGTTKTLTINGTLV